MWCRWVLVAVFVAGGWVRAYGADAISVAVELSPAGEFTISAPAVQGKLRKNQNGFTADNISVPLDSLVTGIKLRDEHLREKLGWPAVKTVSVGKIEIKGDSGKGVMTVNKVSKPINFKVKDVDKLVAVEFPLSLEEFGIKGVRYLGVGVENEITVEAVVPYEQ